MAQQTAVEWLRNKLLIKDNELEDLFEQAKAMEKEQIIDAYKGGVRLLEGDVESVSQDYYRKTYKN